MPLAKNSLDDLRIDRSAPEKPRSIIWVVLLIAIVAAAAVVSWLKLRPAVASVQTLAVRESSTGGEQVLLNASGYVTARRESTVSAKVTGKVVEVMVEEGMRVKEGQILARLDDSNASANHRLVEAQLASAQSRLAETKVRIREAELEYKRVSDLAENKIATTADLDRAQAELNSLKARFEQQAADVTVADRQIALSQQQLEDTVIRAPFAGVVVSKDAQPGEMISPISAGGGFTRTGICTIVDMDSLEIEIDVNESYINRVSAAQPVTATLDAYSDWAIPAQVVAIIPTADRQKATVKVRVGFDKLDPRILPQMGVKVAFKSSAAEGPITKTLLIPKKAIHQIDGRDIVFVFMNGRVERRAVSLGASRGEDVLIAAGLSAGEKVILEGPANLSEGDRVEETK